MKNDEGGSDKKDLYFNIKVPVLAPVFVQIHVNQCNLLHNNNCKLNWYNRIQICVNLWKSTLETHNQGVDGSSPSGPTVKNDKPL